MSGLLFDCRGQRRSNHTCTIFTQFEHLNHWEIFNPFPTPYKLGHNPHWWWFDTSPLCERELSDHYCCVCDLQRFSRPTDWDSRPTVLNPKRTGRRRPSRCWLSVLLFVCVDGWSSRSRSSPRHVIVLLYTDELVTGRQPQHLMCVPVLHSFLSMGFLILLFTRKIQQWINDSKRMSEMHRQSWFKDDCVFGIRKPIWSI